MALSFSSAPGFCCLPIGGPLQRFEILQRRGRDAAVLMGIGSLLRFCQQIAELLFERPLAGLCLRVVVDAPQIDLQVRCWCGR
jgi:hypothetical protein